MIWREWQITFLRFTYRYHTYVVSLAWAIGIGWLVTSGWILVGYWTPVVVGPWLGLLWMGVGALTLAGIPFLVVWVLISGWHAVWFRYLVWWLARLGGWCRQRLLSGWPGLALLLLATMALRWVYDSLTGAPRTIADYLKPEALVESAGLVAALAVAYWAAEARRRIVILGFVDHSGDANLKAAVESAATQLLNDLSDLAQLYQFIEDTDIPDDVILRDPAKQRSGGGSAKRRGITGGVALSVTDIGQSLQGIVTADSKIKFGGLEVPIGALLGTLSRVVEGPRLMGSLLKVGEDIVLIASLRGGRSQGQWRITQADLSSPLTPTPTLAIQLMVEGLAYRIFTDLEQAHLGSRNWRAVYAFSQGVGAYREAQQGGRQRNWHLRRAERYFAQALEHDSLFERCHYSLGITRRSLLRNREAELALSHAIEAESNLSDALYAQALGYWISDDLQQVRKAINLCVQMTRLQPGDARAWNLMGMTQRWLNQNRLPGANRRRRRRDPEWTATVETCAIGAALAWQALCRSAWSQQEVESQRAIATVCLRSLSYVLDELAHAHSLTVLQQALHLSPINAALRESLGWIYTNHGRWPAAIQAFTAAAQIADTPTIWRALAYAEQQRLAEWPGWLDWLHRRLPDKAKRSISQVWLRWLRWRHPRISEATRYAVAEAWRRAGEGAPYVRDEEARETCWYLRGTSSWPDRLYPNLIADRPALAHARWLLGPVAHLEAENFVQKRLLQQWLDLQKKGYDQLRWGKQGGRVRRHYLVTLNRRLKVYRTLKWPRSASLVSIQLAEELPPMSHSLHLREMLDWLLPRFASEVEFHDLYGRLVQSYLTEKKLDLALKTTREMMAFGLDQPYHHQLAGRVYLALEDYTNAELELRASLSLDVPDPSTLQELADVFWRRAGLQTQPKERAEAFGHAIGVLSEILEAMEGTPAPSQSYELGQQVEARALLHYWLGRFHVETLQPHKAMSLLKIAVALQFRRFEAQATVIRAALSANLYDEVESQACRLIEMVMNAVQEFRRKHRYLGLYTLYNARDGLAPGENAPAAYWCGLAKLWQALALAERGTRWRQAEKQIWSASRRLQYLSLASEERQEYAALCHEVRGWLYFKQGRGADSMPELEQSVGLRATASAYVRLARACAAQAEAEAGCRDEWEKKAYRAAVQARQHDVRGEYGADIEALLAAPKEKPAPPSPRVIQATVHLVTPNATEPKGSSGGELPAGKA